MPRKPKFAADGQATTPTTLRLPADVADAIRGNQTTRDRATDAVIREVRSPEVYSSRGQKGAKKAPKKA